MLSDKYSDPKIDPDATAHLSKVSKEMQMG